MKDKYRKEISKIPSTPKIHSRIAQIKFKELLESINQDRSN